MEIRQPIVTVAGHVDHGKTSILDSIRGTKIQEGEAGGITQKISFTKIPAEIIKERSSIILEKFKIELGIPGFLFIDTPGHAAFTNIRKRGGSLADIAILVIDINDGIKPQTAEVIQILKQNKTPFIIALNKIDNISGWKTSETKFSFESIDNQALHVKQNFDEKFYVLIGALQSYKIEAELYTKIKDFTKNVAVIPTSAKTGEGISEILAILTALSQKFLKKRLKINSKGRGVILEVKKEKSIGYLESILYDGEITDTDQIAIASFNQEPIVTKVRNIQEVLPLNRGFKITNKSRAASGLRLQIASKEDILPGMPFRIFKSQEELDEIKKEFLKEVSEGIKTDSSGIVVKADSLGSLEAIISLLRQKQIKIFRVGIGPITKKDVYLTNSLPKENRVILGFNSDLMDKLDVDELKNIKIISNPVVYKIIEDYEKWRRYKLKEIEEEKLNELSAIVKLEILDCVFRNSNPAVFGVRVKLGKLKKQIGLINGKNEKIARVKTIQEDKTSLYEAASGKEVAISLPGINFERQLSVGEILFSNISETQFKNFKENKVLLTSEEKMLLQEIAEVKRKVEVTWGL